MGKVVAVLGLGESLKYYNKDGWDATIGVNDIWRQVQTDYVVCVDMKCRFTPERLKVIEECRPKTFYSIFPTWEHPKVNDWADRPDIQHIELQHDYPNYVCQLDIPAVPKSLCSPFVAAAIAFKYLGADELHVFGVDLLTHPTLKDQQCARIKQHFTTLKAALKQAGCGIVFYGNGILTSLNK
jgi:hypothetical protein